MEVIHLQGVEVRDYPILWAWSAAVPNAIAATLLAICDYTSQVPHAYFGWAEGNSVQYLLYSALFY